MLLILSVQHVYIQSQIWGNVRRKRDFWWIGSLNVAAVVTFAFPPWVSRDNSSSSFRMSSSLQEDKQLEHNSNTQRIRRSLQPPYNELDKRQEAEEGEEKKGKGKREKMIIVIKRKVSYSKSSFLAPFFFFFPFASLEAPAPSISAARASMSMPSSLALRMDQCYHLINIW